MGFLEVAVPEHAPFHSVAFFPKAKPLSIFHKTYFELVNAATFPALFTFLFLKNECNPYWYASLIVAGLLQGLMAKPYIYFWAFPAASAAATYVFSRVHPDAHELIIHSIQAQLVAYFLGSVTSAIKTALEYSHEQIMFAKIALAKAENDSLTAELTRKAYEELKVREELIRIYIRPSLVDEIRSGKNPSEFKPVMNNLAIMFCDIRDFTRLTEMLNPFERQAFLNHYFSMMTRPIVQNGGGKSTKSSGTASWVSFRMALRPSRLPSTCAWNCRNSTRKIMPPGAPKSGMASA